MKKLLYDFSPIMALFITIFITISGYLVNAKLVKSNMRKHKKVETILKYVPPPEMKKKKEPKEDYYKKVWDEFWKQKSETDKINKDPKPIPPDPQKRER